MGGWYVGVGGGLEVGGACQLHGRNVTGEGGGVLKIGQFGMT